MQVRNHIRCAIKWYIDEGRYLLQYLLLEASVGSDNFATGLSDKVNHLDQGICAGLFILLDGLGEHKEWYGEELGRSVAEWL